MSREFGLENVKGAVSTTGTAAGTTETETAETGQFGQFMKCIEET